MKERIFYIRDVVDNRPIGAIMFDFYGGTINNQNIIYFAMGYSRCSNNDIFNKKAALNIARMRLLSSPVMQIRHDITIQEISAIFDAIGVPHDTNFKMRLPKLLSVINSELIVFLLRLSGYNGKFVKDNLPTGEQVHNLIYACQIEKCTEVNS